MSTAEQPDFFSLQQYLEIEGNSLVKNEYIDGWIRAMTGATNRHSKVSLNCACELKRLLKGSPCEPYCSDTKVRIRNSWMNRFYYPDVQVVCDPNPGTDVFQDRPVLIVEVLSPSTRLYDLDEKLNAYLMIPSLKCYLILEQHQPIATAIFRDGDSILQQQYQGIGAVIDLPFLQVSLALSAIYEGVEFTPTCVQESELEYRDTSNA